MRQPAPNRSLEPTDGNGFPCTVRRVNNRPSSLLHVNNSVLRSMRAASPPVTPDQMTDALLAAWWMSRWESASDKLLRSVASRARVDGGIPSMHVRDRTSPSALLPTALFVAAVSARSLVRPALLLDAVDMPDGDSARLEVALARASVHLVEAAAVPDLAGDDQVTEMRGVEGAAEDPDPPPCHRQIVEVAHGVVGARCINRSEKKFMQPR